MTRLIPTPTMAVVPKKAFADWLAQTIRLLEIQLPPAFMQPNEKDLYANCALFLVPPFADNQACEKYIADHYKAIFVNCLYMWCQDHRFWPQDCKDNLTLELFNSYFYIELHSRFYALPSEQTAGSMR